MLIDQLAFTIVQETVPFFFIALLAYVPVSQHADEKQWAPAQHSFAWDQRSHTTCLCSRACQLALILSGTTPSLSRCSCPSPNEYGLCPFQKQSSTPIPQATSPAYLVLSLHAIPLLFYREARTHKLAVLLAATTARRW